MTLMMKRTAMAVLIVLATTGAAAPARADIGDYQFQLVKTAVKQGPAAEIAVRLIDKRTNRPVPDAVIFSRRVDMAPDGMEMMAAPIEPLPSTEAGVYRFKANLGMAGGWRLSLAAKLQGETGTLESRLVFQVAP
jgi:hypothetical protein